MSSKLNIIIISQRQCIINDNHLTDIIEYGCTLARLSTFLQRGERQKHVEVEKQQMIERTSWRWRRMNEPTNERTERRERERERERENSVITQTNENYPDNMYVGTSRDIAR